MQIVKEIRYIYKIEKLKYIRQYRKFLFLHVSLSSENFFSWGQWIGETCQNKSFQNCLIYLPISDSYPKFDFSIYLTIVLINLLNKHWYEFNLENIGNITLINFL